MRREAHEELTYSLENPRLIMIQKFKGKHTEGTKYVFMEKYDFKKKIMQKEGQDKRWFSLNESFHLKIIDHDIDVLKFIKDKY